MTNAELLAKIKAEIERQAKSIDTATGDFAEGRRMEQRIILSFLSTLESEKPMNLEGLEEETIRIEFHAIADKCFNEGIEGWEREKLIARHFAQWGAEHSKK